MASIHKQPHRPFWYCAFTTPDGVRHFKSTKRRKQKQAEEICRAWEKAGQLAQAGKLTPDTAREVIARGVADIFFAANAEAMPCTTTRTWCEQWLSAKEIESEETTLTRYTGIIKRFLDHLDTRSGKDIATIQAKDILVFRDRQAKELSRNSANLSIKVLRTCFGSALKAGLIQSNPATLVDKLKIQSESRRRNFTVAEIKRVLVACGDTEWRGLVLFGCYTGQRLGDLARLTWRAVNLETKELAFTTGKTGKRMVLPLARPLIDYLTGIPSVDDPDAALFPKAAAAPNGSTLSNQFHRILAEAGLAEAKPHRATGKGRNTSRTIGELSFHSLRHSATTFLKASGCSDVLAREIIGHDSTIISRGYTHLATDDLRGAIDRLPDVTAEE